MKSFVQLVAAVACVVGATSAAAQYVKGNEAVKVMPDGSRKVELAPFPRSGPLHRDSPCRLDGNCEVSPILMVETKDGLKECTEAYARPGTCRASTYGSIKRARLWVVKADGKWRHCQYPDLKSRCVDMFAPPPANLPYDAIQ